MYKQIITKNLAPFHHRAVFLSDQTLMEILQESVWNEINCREIFSLIASENEERIC